ncbi:MAG: hypothetical protein VW405_07320 [Rhodospirillaceae bacterium]
MNCTECGRWWPADRQTGYDADGVCRACEDALEAREMDDPDYWADQADEQAFERAREREVFGD